MENKPLGPIKSCEMELEEPLKASYNISWNSLNVLVGKNGTGKTLVLKLNFALATLANTIIEVEKHSEIKKIFDPSQVAQEIFDRTFEDQNFHGGMKINWEHGGIKLIFDKGKVTYLEIDLTANESTPVIFMSTSMRLFSQIKTYLKIEKLCKDEEQLFEFYKLYDVVYVNRLKARFAGGGRIIPEEIRKTWEESFDIKHDIQAIKAKEDGIYAINTKGDETDLATLSNGEQAMINMTIVQL